MHPVSAPGGEITSILLVFYFYFYYIDIKYNNDCGNRYIFNIYIIGIIMEPQLLKDWLKENRIDDNMVYKGGYNHQIEFMITTLGRAFIDLKWDTYENVLKVISTHRSKSIELPVYQIVWHDTEFIMRNNFHDWKVTVLSDGEPIKGLGKTQLFNPNEKINSCYCEGFEEDWVWGSYNDNNCYFTVELQSEYDLYTFIRFIAMKILG